MIFALRARPPRTKTAALFAGIKGLLVLIYAKMFNYWIIISRFCGLSTGKLEIFLPRPGEGLAPPIFFGLAKENPPEGPLLPLRGNSPSGPRPVQKKNALADQLNTFVSSRPKYGGRCSRRGGDLLGLTGVRFELVEHWGGSSRIWGIGYGFRGRSSQGLHHKPRAFRFATRYVGDIYSVAAAKRGAQPMRFSPTKANQA